MMENNNEQRNKKIIVTLVVLILLLVTIVGITYAYFSAKSEAKPQPVTTAKVDLVVEVNPDATHIKDIKPTTWNSDMNQNNENLDIAQIPIKVTSNSSIDINYNLFINAIDLKLNTDNSQNNKSLEDGKLSDVKYKLYDEEGSEINSGTLDSPTQTQKIVNNKNISKNTTHKYILYVYIEETSKAQNRLQGLNFNIKIDAEAVTFKNEPNKPELASGMIPVTYDEVTESWVKRDKDSSDWYDYDIQKWANAVTVTNDTREKYQNAEIGTTISMADINSMWVWIPRYKYKIPSDIGIGDSGYFSNPEVVIPNPPEISVIFEEGTKTTGVDEETYKNGIKDDGTNSNYYTHPAFTFDDKELTGIWVGKFETSTDDENCNKNSNTDNCLNVDPTIKPDVTSLRNQSISTEFITSLKFSNGVFNNNTGEVTFKTNSENKYGLNTEKNSINTHQAKGTEWGAVAILSQSKYGKHGNPFYSDDVLEKEVYVNNSSSMYTGRSAGSPAKEGTNYYLPDGNMNTPQFGSYSYNDYTCSTTSELCVGNKDSGRGRGASTTGTIYGVYDMSGGAWEYTMAHCEGNWSSSGFTTSPTKAFISELKSCNNNYNLTKDKTILGDAGWETAYWYYDQDHTVSSEAGDAFYVRGGRFNSGSFCGTFAGTSKAGSPIWNYSFRTILISS